MQLIQEPAWPSLAGLYRAVQDEAGQHLVDGNFEAAAAGYERAYRALLDAQPVGRRFQKGEALHKWGLALLWLGRTDEARQRTLEAFVEDAALLAEENPRYEELDRSAAHNLVYVFGFAGQALAVLSRFVRDFIHGGNLLPDPRPFLESTIRVIPPPPPPPGGLKIIGQHRLPHEFRVFVGGGFIHLGSHRTITAGMVRVLDVVRHRRASAPDPEADASLTENGGGITIRAVVATPKALSRPE